MAKRDPCGSHPLNLIDNAESRQVFLKRPLFPVSGGLQDYHYNYANCMEVTMELGCCKFPAERDLLSKFLENRESMISFLQQVHMGRVHSNK